MDTAKAAQRTSVWVRVVAIALVISAVPVIGWYALPRKQHPAGSQKFFSDDDGTTWFIDDANKIPPFDHAGKQAVWAKVFTQNSDGTPFVAYLEKYNDQTKARLEAAHPATPTHAGVSVTHGGINPASPMLVKKPHEGGWVPADSPEGQKVMQFAAPDGSKQYTPMAPE